MTDNTMREAFERDHGPLCADKDMQKYFVRHEAAMQWAWQAAQSVPVMGEALLYALVKDGSVRFSCESAEVLTRNKNIHGYELVPLHAKPPTSITQAELDAKDARIVRQHRQIIEEMVRTEAVKQELGALRKDAEKLQKDAERMQKALSEIAEWTDRYTSPGHPIGTVARAAMQEHKE